MMHFIKISQMVVIETKNHTTTQRHNTKHPHQNGNQMGGSQRTYLAYILALHSDIIVK